MGLLRASANAITGFMADQYRHYFYADAMPNDVLAMRARKRATRRIGFWKNESEAVIPNGSVINVNEGQCMLLVDAGRVIDLCAEPGEYLYDTSSEPSLFYGGLSRDGLMDTLNAMADRLAFGGEAPKDQRVYYINLKEIVGNKYGTPNPVPFRVREPALGAELEITLRCFGEYAYRITNPLLFYTNVCGNVEDEYRREALDAQLKGEILTALQPAFARLSQLGVRYSALPGCTDQLAMALNQVLSDRWRDSRGLEVSAFGISSLKASQEDEQALKELSRAAALSGARPAPPQLPSGWVCPACHTANAGKFCTECGAARPQ